MATITTDILLKGIRRDDVFNWLGEPENQFQILDGAFDKIEKISTSEFTLHFRVPPRNMTMGWKFVEKDNAHGGRRIKVETTGRRTTGKIRFSLRTMKPSTNTLVTLHMDYSPGRVLGPLLDKAGTRTSLEKCFEKMLANLEKSLES